MVRARVGVLRAIATVCTYGLAAAASAATPERDWGTYFGVGGTLVYDAAQGAAVDAEGNVYVVGSTSAPDGIATPGAHRTVQEQHEAFLIKLTPGGERLWGTYIGGSGDDGAGAVAVRGDMVVVTGSTYSEGLGTVGAFQPTYPGGYSAFVAAFTADGAPLWGTYFRSFGEPAIGDGAAVFVGGTTTVEIPGLTGVGAHKSSTNATNLSPDGFLARFGDDGQLVWGTYYGGDEVDNDTVKGIALDSEGHILIAGYTECDSGIATPGTYKPFSDGGPKNFLARFTPDGVRTWGSYFGGDFHIQGQTVGVAAIPGGGAFLAGSTSAPAGVATPGTHQEQFGGDLDAYLARFDADGGLLWATYYGGPGYEDFAAVASSASGLPYLSMRTDSDSGIATDGGFQTLRAGDIDIALVKFDGSGQRLWGTYYGGAAREEYNYLAAFGSDVVYLVGGTASADGIASPGALDTTYDGTMDQLNPFAARFSQHLGDRCGGADSCSTGFCIDGVCCESACGDGAEDCQVCATALGATEDGVCTLLGMESICRPAGGPCDPAEQCTGRNAACPEDVTALDGQSCNGGMCMDGACVPDEPTGGDEPTGSGGDAGSGGDTGSDGGTGTGEKSTGDEGSAGGSAGVDAAPEGCGCTAPGVGSLPGALVVLCLSRRKRRA